MFFVALSSLNFFENLSPVLHPVARDRLEPAPAVEGQAIHRNFKLDRYMEVLFITFDLAARPCVNCAFGPIENDLAEPADRGVGRIFFRDNGRGFAAAGHLATVIDIRFARPAQQNFGGAGHMIARHVPDGPLGIAADG